VFGVSEDKRQKLVTPLLGGLKVNCSGFFNNINYTLQWKYGSLNKNQHGKG
jgi:hypothetical protein